MSPLSGSFKSRIKCKSASKKLPTGSVTAITLMKNSRYGRKRKTAKAKVQAKIFRVETFQKDHMLGKVRDIIFRNNLRA